MSLIAFKLLKSRNGATPFLELHHTLHKLLPYEPAAKAGEEFLTKINLILLVGIDEKSINCYTLIVFL